MIFLFVGPSGCGKSTAIRSWLMPRLMSRPLDVCKMAPPKFDVAMVLDEPTNDHPEGEYPGARFEDAADFLRRSGDRTLISCFSNASVEGLCKLAWQRVPYSLLVLDEIDECMSSSRELTEYEKKLCNKGRKNGIALAGTARRWYSVNVELRGNVQYLFINGISNQNDVNDAAKTLSLPPRLLQGFQLPSGGFLEWSRPDNALRIVHFDPGNGRKTILVNGRNNVINSLEAYQNPPASKRKPPRHRR